MNKTIKRIALSLLLVLTTTTAAQAGMLYGTESIKVDPAAASAFFKQAADCNSRIAR